MKNKNIIWWVLIIIGLIPFIFVLGSGLISAISGTSGLCLLNCTLTYGWDAFLTTIILQSYLLWPTYIIGIVLIIIGLFKIIEKRKQKEFKDLL